MSSKYGFSNRWTVLPAAIGVAALVCAAPPLRPAMADGWKHHHGWDGGDDDDQGEGYYAPGYVYYPPPPVVSTRRGLSMSRPHRPSCTRRPRPSTMDRRLSASASPFLSNKRRTSSIRVCVARERAIV